MTYAAIEELTQALIDPPLYLTTADVWQTYMDESEHDPLAYMSFPPQQRTKLHSTNPIERLNKEAKRRAVLADECEPVSAGTATLSLTQRKDHATRRARRRGSI